ncbi:DUF177 domain-containing protein [bacterium LRH843]|nr:DUF177 domain-containing protein [bacterium LRH843]
MKWSLQQLNSAKRKPFTFDETIDLSSLKETSNEIRKVSPIRVKGSAVYSGSMITFTLHVSGELILPCARSLADVQFQIDLDVIERYYPANEYMGEELDDDDIHLFEGDIIDLTPAVKERILLEIPIQVYADENVLEQALESGEGWEFLTEERKKNRIDPRFADLAKFFDKD